MHTLLYNYQWEHRRDPDGVPVELALDHPYRGFVTVFIDRDESISNEELWSWLRTEHLPGLLPGTDADLVAAFTPIALEVDAPGDVPREKARDNRTVLLWFLNTPPEVAWEPVIVEHRRRSRRRARARSWRPCPSSPPSRARTPTPTSSGRTETGATAVTACRRDHPRARISTCGMTKTASCESAQRRNASAIAWSSSASLSPYSTACSAKRE